MLNRCPHAPDQSQLPANIAVPAASPAAGVSCNIVMDTKSGKAELARPEGALPIPAVDLLHRLSLDGAAYVKLAAGIGSQVRESAVDYMQEYMAQMAPRTPAERMLAAQMLWQHARIAGLIDRSGKIHDPRMLGHINNAIDSAMNVARRQAVAWAQVRSPRSVQYIEGQQVNVASQQVVVNGVTPVRTPGGPQNVANEQGSPAPLLPQAAIAAPQVPAIGGGIENAASLGAGGAAVDGVHGAPHAQGQSPGIQKRAAARPALRGRGRGKPEVP